METFWGIVCDRQATGKREEEGHGREPWEPFKGVIMRLEIRGHSKAAEDQKSLRKSANAMAWPEASTKNSKVVSSSTASGDEVDSPKTNKVTVAMSQCSQSFR